MWPLSFIMTNWKLILVAVLAAALVASGYQIGVWRMTVQEAAALADQKKDLTAQCDADKHITQEANDGLQKQVDAIGRKLAAAKRMHVARCVVPFTGNSQPAAGGNGHAGQDGLSSEWLYDYAAECETYRQERITLENFITETWAGRK